MMIVKMRFETRPWWLRETTSKTILVAEFADGRKTWVAWSWTENAQPVSAAAYWHYFIAKLEIAEVYLEDHYLRDTKQQPRFHGVRQG
jgi:hypothetical protein